MSYDHKAQRERNQAALENPQPGDYWSEMFCPYFVVVELLDHYQYRVLSCLGGPNSFNRKDEPNARVDNGDDTWSFDYSKDMIVDLKWIADTVRYKSIDGFVAHVDDAQRVVTEWRSHRAAVLRKEWEDARAKWEQFTGWSALKPETIKE
jgi:hypothetical protein